MKNIFVFVVLLLLVGGCATPKIGEDILIEPQGNIRFENSGSELVMGILTLLGVGDENQPIRLGSDLKVINKWHSNLKLVSLTYRLEDEKEGIIKGEAAIGKNNPIVIESGKEKMIPLVFTIDPKSLDSKRMMGIIQSKHKLILKGDAVIEVWGIQHHYPFEKDSTKLIQKALIKGGVLG
ncbi:MAG: hypothetical protein PHI47_04680 [Sulfuricurvum sp.]|uniref:hypothetical protein n=1 Tax=Sulfuricurvum sp. TaxID=2025608 RepID=UPI0026350277|nr:hypothetical protein [Sulfuricurvum sp.]MDD5159323.1 hypothetical protein [Sulfuricurvum sp.]